MRSLPIAVVLLGLSLSGTLAAQALGASAPGTDARPNPDANGVYRVRDGVTAPKLVFSVEPDFSEKARKKKISGSCKVALTVDVAGQPKDVRVLHSNAENSPPKQRAAALSLDEEAMKAVRQYRFEPGTFQGKAVPVALIVEVNFQIF